MSAPPPDRIRVPEPGAVRSGMGLAGSRPQDPPHRAFPRRREGLERLGRVNEILEVAREDPGPLHDLEHPEAFIRRPAEGLRAQDRLPGLRGQPDGLLVDIIGEPDDDDLRVRILDSIAEIRGPARDIPLRRERLGPLRRARIDVDDAVPASQSVEGLGIEGSDEPCAEHRDRGHPVSPGRSFLTSVQIYSLSGRISQGSPDPAQEKKVLYFPGLPTYYLSNISGISMIEVEWTRSVRKEGGAS